jgi:carbonic anhydrase
MEGMDNSPASAADAIARLEEGSRRFAALVPSGREAVAHRPFAAVVGCSDARVPVEVVLGQGPNELFVVRVVGNVAGSDALGSLGYAIDNLASVRLVAVLGHTGCGAVAAAVDEYLQTRISADPALRVLIDRVLSAVRRVDGALVKVHGDAVTSAPGYGIALAVAAVPLNAAINAAELRRAFAGRADGRGVVYGVYDLATRSVGAGDGEPGWRPAPADDDGMATLARRLARAPGVLAALDSAASPDV